jgi:hypothetical protein
MVSPTEGWGIGALPLPQRQSGQAVAQGGAIWHYANGQWKVVERIVNDPYPYIDLRAIQAVAVGDVWVSVTTLSSGSRLTHLFNGVWQDVSAPIRDGLLSIAMPSPTEGWGVGFAGQILHYQNGVWTDYPTGA